MRRRGGGELLRFGFVGGWEAVVVVDVDGGAEGFAPAVGAEGVDVFVLGEVDGLQLGLEHVGDGAGESGFYIAADHGGDEACQGGAEVAGGEVVAREEAGEVLAEFFSGLGAGLLLGMIEAEVGMVAGAGRAAAAAIFKRKQHKNTRSFGLSEDIEVSLELSFGFTGRKKRTRRTK